MAGFGKNQPSKKKNTKAPNNINSNEDALLKSAISHHVKGDIINAEKGYREAIRIGCEKSSLFTNLGIICKNSGRTREAIQLYEKAIEINPEDSNTYYNIGNLYDSLGLLEKAVNFTLKSLELNPNNPDAHMNLGRIQRDLGEINQALYSTLKSLELKPNNPDAYINLGAIFQDLGELDKALAATLKSLELNPNNYTSQMNLGSIYKDLGNLDRALAATLKSLELYPTNAEAHMNLGGIYRDLGNHDKALAATLKALDLGPKSPVAYMNLGGIYQDLDKLDMALSSTLQSLELNPNNPDAHINLGGIYKDLGKLDKALSSTLKALELKPESSQALCKLGLIKMALGHKDEAKRNLFISIKRNGQNFESHYAISTMLETKEEAEEIIELIGSIKKSPLTPQTRAFAEFALSNCFHKTKNYDSSSKHLQLANKYKLIAYPSNAKARLEEIDQSIKDDEATHTTDIDTNFGKGRIFIVGMPRSGSTLLETVLCMNPEIKDLGESRSLERAITKIQKPGKREDLHQKLNDEYTLMEPFDTKKYKYTTDKQLYNFLYIDWIINHMPASKIIHCQRNPMDNILSMYRSNLMTGNNYTACPEDAAKVLIAQEQAMQIHKKRHASRIFTFNYDQFVNAPEANLRKLLEWLDLEFDESYLHPEKSTRSVNTASVMQARQAISNKSVGGWKNYKELLWPALKIIQESSFLIP